MGGADLSLPWSPPDLTQLLAQSPAHGSLNEEPQIIPYSTTTNTNISMEAAEETGKTREKLFKTAGTCGEVQAELQRCPGTTG